MPCTFGYPRSRIILRRRLAVKDRLILFVHGLGGTGEATWRRRGCPGFPELVKLDKPLQNEADVAFFQYPTSLYRLPLTRKALRIRDLAEGLRSEIELRYSEYKSIALVCHSLGGLVARKYLIEEAMRESELRVDKLLLFAVPNHGAGLASIAKYVSWRNNQLVQLCRNSELIEELHSDWTNLNLDTQVQVRYVIAGQDRVVDKQSAINQWGNSNVDSILDAGHTSVVKPQVTTDLAYLIFRRFVLGPVSVFLSVGGGRTKTQESFVSAIKNFFISKGLDARTVDEYGATNRQPLKDVEYRMNRCYGAVVLAFERTRIEVGVSRPGADAERPLQNLKLPPVWNQIEAAMAYTRGLPLFVIVEHGLEYEGMLESKYDWRVKFVHLNESIVDDPEFLGIFEDWREQVLSQRDTI